MTKTKKLTLLLGIAGILAAALITLVSGMEAKACEASFEDLASDPGVTVIAAPAAPESLVEETKVVEPAPEAEPTPSPAVEEPSAPAPTPAVVEEAAPVIEEPSAPAPTPAVVEEAAPVIVIEEPSTPVPTPEQPVESEPSVASTKAVIESEKEDTVTVEHAKTIQVKAAKVVDVTDDEEVEEPEEINIPWYLGFFLLLFLFARRYEVVEMSENKENDRTRKFFSLRKAAEYVRDYEFSDSESEVLVVAINNRFRKDEEKMVYAIDKAENLFVETLWVQSDSEYDILNDVLGYEREAEEEYADLVEAALAAA